MKLHYGGKFRTEENFKVTGELLEGSVAFKEPDAKVFGYIANGGSFAGATILLVIVCLYSGIGVKAFASRIGFAALLSMITLVPHEFLHALCFKEDVYLYHDFSKGLLFVHGIEKMTKVRFVFMSLLPNLVFGVVPFVVFLCNPQWGILGMIGALCISIGFGDYINVFNALTQMPKGAKTYLHKFHSYWVK